MQPPVPPTSRSQRGPEGPAKAPAQPQQPQWQQPNAPSYQQQAPARTGGIAGWRAVLALLLCWPIGIILVWLTPWSRRTKTTITLVLVGLILASFVLSAVTAALNSSGTLGSGGLGQLPNSFVGTWSGTFNQDRVGSYPLTVILRAGKLNDSIGSVSYPKNPLLPAPCTTTLTLQHATDQEVLVHEHVVSGPCFDTNDKLRVSGDTLNIDALDSQGHALGTGHLVKAKP